MLVAIQLPQDVDGAYSRWFPYRSTRSNDPASGVMSSGASETVLVASASTTSARTCDAEQNAARRQALFESFILAEPLRMTGASRPRGRSCSVIPWLREGPECVVVMSYGRMIRC